VSTVAGSRFTEESNSIYCDFKDNDLFSKKSYFWTCDLSSQNINQTKNLISTSKNATLKGLQANDNKEIKVIPENIFEKFPNLKRITFWADAIRIIEKKHFKGMKKLEELRFNYNEIETIAEGSFNDLKNLKILNLHSNKIKNLHMEIFQTLTKLDNLYLTYNHIDFLPENIFNSLKNLRLLDLGNNKIKILSEKVFVNLISLENITLRNNELTKLPKHLLSENKKLENIWFSENDINWISSDLFNDKINLTFVELIGTCAGDFYHKEKFEILKKDLNNKCADPEETYRKYKKISKKNLY
jgi:Leucine-rich repeat (LRR) protein